MNRKHQKQKTYFIKTFGCQMNFADSERIDRAFADRGYRAVARIGEAETVVINTCIVRQSAENRVYGLINNLSSFKGREVVLTGCLAGWALKDKSGASLKLLRKRIGPAVRVVGIEELADLNLPSLRVEKDHAWVPISNGCNNLCSFCIVPQARGREVSRPFEQIVEECRRLKKEGYKKITLLGQNVNSYGADLIKLRAKSEKLKAEGKKLKITVVKRLGRPRLPTLFPALLESLAEIGFEKIDFISSNPWDFSDELIEMIARYPNIARLIHLPVQSGDDKILRKMNRRYTAGEYLTLVGRIKKAIPKAGFTTDIIVGFPGETKRQFENTVKLCRQVGFRRVFIGRYSLRTGTPAARWKDDVPPREKKRRWRVLEELVNKRAI